MNLEDSIDERNEKLFNELRSRGIEIEFSVDEKFNSWAVQPKYKYKIVANNRIKSPAALTHELLHIICHLKGFINTFTIIDIFKPNNTRFKTNNLSDIQNILAHLKMFPIFCKMGFNVEDFYTNQGDELIRKTLISNLTPIKLHYEISKISKQKPTIEIITAFFQLIIIIKQIELEENYLKAKKQSTEYFNFLNSCDKDLFATIKKELEDWLNSDTFSNYDFYMNINEKLDNLGYPIENEWEEWLMKK